VEAKIASCHCGDVRIECLGVPRKISMCHCADCQRRTGSAFSIAVFYERPSVRLESGGLGGFERLAANGSTVLFHFCTRCGSNVMWEPRRLPDLVGIAAGAFADSHFPQPEQSVWTKDKHAWVMLPEAMQCFEANPPPRDR
jgi:hypothetical protein